jgi:hypothetical protein
MAAIAYLRSAMMPAPSDFSKSKVPELVEILDDGTVRPFDTRIARPKPVGRAYAHQVLRTEPTVAVSAAPGIDVRFISWHARHALRALLVRDVLAALVLIATLILEPLPAACWLGALIVWVIQPEDRREKILRYLVLVAAGAGLVAAYLRSPRQGLHWSSPAIGLAVLVAVFAADLVFVERTIRSIMKGPARPDALGFRGRPGARLERIVAEQHGNAVSYVEQHIIGVGSPQPTPPINIKINARERARTARHIQPVDLLDHVMRDLDALARPDNVEYGIENLEVRPVRVGPRDYWDSVDADDLDSPHHSVARQPVANRSVRVYVRARAVLWDGQIVPTIYIGAAVEGDLLRFIFRPYVLHPLGESAKVVRKVAKAGPSALGALRHTRTELGLLTGALRDGLALGRWAAPNQDGPISTSLRELHSARTRDLHMTEDAQRFLHNVTVTVFDSAVDFLDRAGVDVSEFKRQAQTIVTNIISGSVVSGNLQMGGGRGGQIMKANTN